MNELIFTDAYFMKEALKEASQAFEKDEVPVGAIIVSENKIIARSHNLVETLNDSTAHAEILAITAAENSLGSKYLNECTLYVTLEPCVMCAGAMNLCKLGRLVFGTKDPKMGFQKFSDMVLHPSTKLSMRVMESESSAILKIFFSKKR
ncbi:MAG: nucleoside deaminase [Bacteroidota bacterium]|nr:nucleoside deaminase [Bacteroidota bacterium]